MERRDSKRRWKALIVISLISMVVSITSFMFNITASHASGGSGAAFTTVNPTADSGDFCLNGSGTTNCNIYTAKQFVWLTGGPSTAALEDGTYFFVVLDPGVQANPNDGAAGNLSSSHDSYTNRTFTISGGAISYSGTHDFDSNLIRLMSYDDTSNPGGVYILAICSLGDGTAYPVDASTCKYDAFKVAQGGTALAPTIAKNAAGVYTTTYGWTIAKSVDKTKVEQVGGTATFTYTVKLAYDSGTDSGVTVSGTIDVTNQNTYSDGTTVPVAITGVTDQLSDGTVCSVTNGGPQNLTQLDTYFQYTCSLSAVPTASLDNTATVTWADQLLGNAAWLAGGSKGYTYQNIAFTQTKVNNCVTVTDNFNGTTTTLGTPCVGDTNPTVYTYSHTVSVPQSGCVTYNNTATIIETGQTSGASVQVCGPAKTGALTMGFWQNKNGQGIIKNSASTAGVCNLTTWLRQYAPFQDLSASASCLTVATYVYNVIKAANASGSSMNAMLKAQMLATALDVYYSDPALGGNKISAPAPIGGVAIDLTKVCAMIDGSGGTATCSGNYENVSSAFGGASSLTVSQMLSYAASQSNAGGSVWYGQVKATQGLAKDAFDAINNQVAFGA